MTRYFSRRWDPCRTLLDLQEEINDLFDLGFSSRPFLSERRAPFPRVNVTTDEHSSVLRAEVPGVAEEMLELTVEGDTLTLKGERARDADVPNEHFYRSERGFGSFGRAIRLPHKIDGAHVTASLKNGLLEVTLPKAPEDQPKRITVKQ